MEEDHFQPVQTRSSLKRARQKAARQLEMDALKAALLRTTASQSQLTPAVHLGHPRGVHQWRCPVCDRLNDVTRDVCRECRFDRPARVAPARAAALRLPKPACPTVSLRQTRARQAPPLAQAVTYAHKVGASPETPAI